MGASLPVLTTVLPKESKEINAVHFKIYGWNTLGAFLGVLLSGFYLLPAFGLAVTLVIAAGINLIAGLIFMGNRLEGDVHRQAEFPPNSHKDFPTGFISFLAFSQGLLLSLLRYCLSVCFTSVRGAGVYNFPIILSLFVGGLAWGSLSVKAHKISPAFLIKQILITTVLLGLLFIISPYWSIWISHIRVSLLSIPSNYFVFKVALYLFVALCLLPAVFFMGRLLPLSYALLKKTKDNYGAVCGNLYFFNTLGTVVGTLVIGYLAFYIFDLDDLFKINLFLLMALAFVGALYERRGFLSSCLFVWLLAYCCSLTGIDLATM